MRKPKKILVLICSCQKNREKRDNCRETWLKRKPDNIDYFFFLGGEQGEEKDTLYLDCDDSYAELPAKMLFIFNLVLTWGKLKDYDYVMKCDDDTYVVLDRLDSLLVGNPQVIGDYWISDYAPILLGGAGYLIKTNVLKEIAKKMEVSTKYGEDQQVAIAAQKAGLTISRTDKLQQGNSILPTPENDQITAHWCGKDLMAYIYNGFEMLKEFDNDSLLFKLSKIHNKEKNNLIYSSCVCDIDGIEREGVLLKRDGENFLVKVGENDYNLHISKMRKIRF